MKTRTLLVATPGPAGGGGDPGDTATVQYQSPILNIPVEAKLEQAEGTGKISELGEGV